MRWFDLTEEEADRLNPPPLRYLYDEMTDEVSICDSSGDEWLSVGYIPKPRTRLGWIFYHLIHGLWMKYPLWKVVGFALFDDGHKEGEW